MQECNGVQSEQGERERERENGLLVPRRCLEVLPEGTTLARVVVFSPKGNESCLLGRRSFRLSDRWFDVITWAPLPLWLEGLRTGRGPSVGAVAVRRLVERGGYDN